METGTLRRLASGRAIWWAFLVALAVRGLLLASLHDSYYTSGMAQGELARNIAEGRGFVVNAEFSHRLMEEQVQQQRLIDIGEALTLFPPQDSSSQLRPFIAYMMPGHGILLAATYRLFGEYRYIYLQVIQAILDALGVFLIGWLGTTLIHRRAGILAAFLYALYIPEARLAISATRDAWMPMIYLSTTVVFAKAWMTRRALWWLCAGTVVAVGVYFRSEILLVPVEVGLMLLFTRLRWQDVLRLVMLSFIPIVVLLLPWTIRNAQVFHRFIPTNTGLWMATWQSFGEYRNDFGAVNDDLATLRQMRDQGYTEAYDSPAYDDLFRPKVIGVITTEPGWVAWTVVRRLARIPLEMHAWGLPATEQTSAAESPFHTGSADAGRYWRYVSADPLRLLVHALARGINLLLYVAAAWWVIRLGSTEWHRGAILLAIPVYNILVHTVIGVHARYILPTNALLLIPTALLFLHILRREQEATTTSV